MDADGVREEAGPDDSVSAVDIEAGEDGPVTVFLNSCTDEKHKTGFLQAADLTKKTDEVNCNDASALAMSVKSWRKSRDHFVSVKTTGKCLAISLYDGYNGKKCAEYISAEMNFSLCAAVCDKIPELRKKPAALALALKESFTTVDADFILGELEESTTGCTGAVCLVHDSFFVCAYVGDVAIFTCRNKKAVPLSHTHCPENETERIDKGVFEMVQPFKSTKHPKKYIKVKSGGQLLGVTRTFGNALFKEASDEEKGVIAVPDVTLFEVSENDEFVCVASRSLQELMPPQQICDYIGGKLKFNQSPAEIVSSLLDSAVAANSEKKYGVDNLSLELIMPKVRSKFSNSTLKTTSQSLLDVWERDGTEECFAFSLITDSDVADDRRSSTTEYGSKKLSRSDHRPRTDRELRKLASRSELGEVASGVTYASHMLRIRAAFLLKVALCMTIAATILLLAVVATENYVFAAGIGPVLLLSLAVVGYYWYSMSIANDCSSGAFAVLQGLIICVGYDIFTGCSQDGWALATIACISMVPFQVRCEYIIAFTLLSVIWTIARTIDEGEDFGLIKALPQPDVLSANGETAALVGRGSEWMIPALAGRVLLVSGVGVLSAYLSWCVRTLSKRVETSVRCVGLFAESQRRGSREGCKEAILDLAVTVDSSGVLMGHYTELLATLKKRQTSRVVDTASQLPAGSTSEHIIEVMSRTNESSGGDCETLYDTESLYSDAASRAGSPTKESLLAAQNYIQILKSKNVTVVVLLISSETEVIEMRHLAKAIARALDTSEGTLISFGGNTALVTWNATEPCPSHQQQALTFVQAMADQCAGACEVFMAITNGMVNVGQDSFVKGRATSFIVGKCVSSAYLLATFARNVKAHVVMTEKVYESIRSQIYGRPIDSFVLTDRDRPEVIYELKGVRTDHLPKSCLPLFTEAFSHLQRLEVKEARDKFLEFLEANTKDAQARRLAIMSNWLDETDNLFVQTPPMYSRLLTSELDVIADRENEMKLPGDMNHPVSPSGKKKREPIGFDPLVKRESLNHDKILRRQIRDAEAEANADQLEAWGLSVPGGKTKDKGKRGETTPEPPKVKVLPARFTDHKNRLWCRAARSLGKGAFGEVWLGMSSDGSLVAMKSMRLPTINTAPTPASDGPATTQISAAAKRRLARKQGGGGGGGGGEPNNNKEANLQQIEDLLSEVGLMHKLRHENIVCQFFSLNGRLKFQLCVSIMLKYSIKGIGIHKARCPRCLNLFPMHPLPFLLRCAVHNIIDLMK